MIKRYYFAAGETDLPGGQRVKHYLVFFIKSWRARPDRALAWFGSRLKDEGYFVDTLHITSLNRL